MTKPASQPPPNASGTTFFLGGCEAASRSRSRSANVLSLPPALRPSLSLPRSPAIQLPIWILDTPAASPRPHAHVTRIAVNMVRSGVGKKKTSDYCRWVAVGPDSATFTARPDERSALVALLVSSHELSSTLSGVNQSVLNYHDAEALVKPPAVSV